MPLLPLRALPANGVHDGALSIRVALQPGGPAEIYVRHKTNSKTWVCIVHSMLEIVSQDQQARQLDIIAVVTCLYHGIAYDSTSSTTFAAAPLELVRREVGFSQPETWTDGSYRLTMRVAVQATSMAMSSPIFDPSSQVAQAVPIASMPDEDIVFGFTMTPTTTDIGHVKGHRTRSKCVVTLQIQEPAFPHALLNWMRSSDETVARPVDDGIILPSAIIKTITLKVVHAKGPALVLVSIASIVIEPVNMVTYQPASSPDLQHTIMQFDVQAPQVSLLEVAVLPGSACVLEGSSISIRERSVSPAATKNEVKTIKS